MQELTWWSLGGKQVIEGGSQARASSVAAGADVLVGAQQVGCAIGRHAVV
jgi:hypothetical protein